ncbi:SRPBCC family protein [Thauera sp. Sel9]|uniref:SRPBCC family protein n=1 Tax=Thauera sp. Sel9 TaxID=2974299 RepID=UPI0021E131E8|nr:SRPBCC family protein [Thauera sp. Sel9]MCV2217822.1 SRPBCC family protein [Thauera sp. Sel9]
MKLIHGLAPVILGVSAASVAADAPTLQVEEEVVIAAPADKVWDKVRNFNDLGAWHPAAQSTEIVEGSNNVAGAVRLITLPDGGTIKEKLLSYDDAGKTFKYVILEGVLPVSSYESVVSVKADGANQTRVVWRGDFKRKDTSARPAAGATDEDATTTMTAVYRGGLDNLKKISE